jgi:hypothetical protein
MSSGAFYSAIYTCQLYHVMVKEKKNILSYLILCLTDLDPDPASRSGLSFLFWTKHVATCEGFLPIPFLIC